MSNCAQTCSELFESIVKTVQQVNSKFDCEDIASGEVDQIMSQSNFEMNRYASVMKQEELSPRSSIKVKKEISNDSIQDSMEVYAIILKLFALAIGFGLKMFVKYIEQVHRYICQWIQTLCNEMSETDQRADYSSMDIYKSLKPRSYWICIPLAFLIFAYIICYIFLSTAKILLFKITIKDYLK